MPPALSECASLQAEAKSGSRKAAQRNDRLSPTPIVEGPECGGTRARGSGVSAPDVRGDGFRADIFRAGKHSASGHGGTRYASTGNHKSGTDPITGQPYTRVGSINYYIEQGASVAVSLGATLTSINVSSVYGGAGSAGGPQDIETVSVTATIALMTPIIANFFPKGQYTFTVNSTVKNEPFPPNQTK